MKVTMYMAMTVNGMIAKTNGNTNWTNAEWKQYTSAIKKSDALVIGRKTYEIMKRTNEFRKIGNPLIVIVSKSGKGKNFVKSPKQSLRFLKSKKCKSIIVGGGSKLNSSFMKENLIDEIILDVEPLILGNGIHLFNKSFEKKLKLMKVRKFSKNEIQLHYKVLK